MQNKNNCIDYKYISSSKVKELNNFIFIIPIGSIEQHCDAPMGLDSLIAERIAYGLCGVMENIVVMPTIYYGFSPEWNNVDGTISLNIETFSGFIKSILDSLNKINAKRIVFLNGHGGNSYILEAVLREWINNKTNTIILLNYWKALGINVGHSGSIERSIARALGIQFEESNCNGIIDFYNGASKIIINGPMIGSKTYEKDKIEITQEEILLKIKNEIINGINFAEKIKSNSMFVL
ncbi:uncharacterized protein, putative amidase [Caldisphaera lagunensis DSM 15908]|uniref:Uncharacterized protein, putative amidase n=1 Tax=Caldisphaera lagunensis (strain DSM 15908 / JCM 11604 / ANMR 0165 / IC-154) TaxID=1056495 RepID=L0ACW3_CALLD|nr:creatininase family protein [Caldisphaera lagunensis]AFZ71269.1 uncharacterized protein, putative amidase [Caldisphaera lagunensis DSM 15908]